MDIAQYGDTVKVHYTGRTDAGLIFDSSKENEPLQFEVGGGRMILGFEEAIVGMKPGESKHVTVPVDMAYGPARKDLVFSVERDRIPKNVDLEIGKTLRLERSDGQDVHVLVTDLSETTVELDANHPLAGKDLTFDITLVEIV
jgi:FKBP-type peptidyl-prolyl cis-trans isomerase 2